MRVGINFFQTSVNVDILTSPHKSLIFLMVSRMVNPFQEVFTCLQPDPLEELRSMAAVCWAVTQLCLSLFDPMDYSMLVFSPDSTGVCSNSCPLSWWCYLTILSSAALFSSYPQSFPASGSFPMIWLFASGGQIIGPSASTSVLPMDIQDWFPLELTGLISLQSKGL